MNQEDYDRWYTDFYGNNKDGISKFLAFAHLKSVASDLTPAEKRRFFKIIKDGG